MLSSNNFTISNVFITAEGCFSSRKSITSFITKVIKLFTSEEESFELNISGIFAINKSNPSSFHKICFENNFLSPSSPMNFINGRYVFIVFASNGSSSPFSASPLSAITSGVSLLIFFNTVGIIISSYVKKSSSFSFWCFDVFSLSLLSIIDVLLIFDTLLLSAGFSFMLKLLLCTLGPTICSSIEVGSVSTAVLPFEYIRSTLSKLSFIFSTIPFSSFAVSKSSLLTAIFFWYSRSYIFLPNIFTRSNFALITLHSSYCSSFIFSSIWAFNWFILSPQIPWSSSSVTFSGFTLSLI